MSVGDLLNQVRPVRSVGPAFEPGASPVENGVYPVVDSPPRFGDGFAVEPPAIELSGGYATAPPPAKPQPSPADLRPKKRLIAGTVVVAGSLFAALSIWDALFRFQAYGVISAETLGVSVGNPGRIDAFLVREGDRVAQGQPLVSVENENWQTELGRLNGELNVAIAELDAEAVQLRWQRDVSQDGRLRAHAEHHEAMGRLADEEARLESLRGVFERTRRIMERGSASADEFERNRLQFLGQQAKVEKLRLALGDLAERAQAATEQAAQEPTALGAKRARVEFLRGEIRRLDDRIAQLQVRSPVDGVVLTRHRLAGERTSANEPLLTLLADGSREAILYLPQTKANDLAAGDLVRFQDAATGRFHEGRVVRVDASLQPAPENIATFYRRGERLVTVHARPDLHGGESADLRLGGVVKLPRWGGVSHQESER